MWYKKNCTATQSKLALIHIHYLHKLKKGVFVFVTVTPRKPEYLQTEL